MHITFPSDVLSHIVQHHTANSTAYTGPDGRKSYCPSSVNSYGNGTISYVHAIRPYSGFLDLFCRIVVGRASGRIQYRHTPDIATSTRHVSSANRFTTETRMCGSDILVTTVKTRMWANAQPDGRPAEHRWRPLFNAAKFG